MSHAHIPLGDPRVTAALQAVVDGLRRDPGDRELRTRARQVVGVARMDENPRTRAQARALQLVVDLLDRGAHAEAEDLLANELTRSFPPQATTSPTG